MIDIISQGSGIALRSRYVYCLILSIVLIVSDASLQFSKSIRSFVIDYAVFPITVTLDFPSRFYFNVKNYFQSAHDLEIINQTLRHEIQLQKKQLLTLEQTKNELEELQYTLHVISKQKDFKEFLITEYANISLTDQQELVVINVGQINGILKGKVITDTLGLIGIVSEVYKQTSLVALITDPLLSVPVRISRNGLLATTRGKGFGKNIAIDFVRADEDIRVGDLLETSGIGGIFPKGIPVARVVSITHDQERKTTITEAKTLGRLEYQNKLILHN